MILIKERPTIQTELLLLSFEAGDAESRDGRWSMVYEGRLRKHAQKRAQFEDLEVYGILRENY